jgi:hypothetical protein
VTRGNGPEGKGGEDERKQSILEESDPQNASGKHYRKNIRCKNLMFSCSSRFYSILTRTPKSIKYAVGDKDCKINQYRKQIGKTL